MGIRKYYLNNNGILHREGLPAIEYLSGAKRYYIHGKLHREDGPAIEGPKGYKFYCLNDISFSEEDYWKEIKRRKSLNYILKEYCEKKND